MSTRIVTVSVVVEIDRDDDPADLIAEIERALQRCNVAYQPVRVRAGSTS